MPDIRLLSPDSPDDLTRYVALRRAMLLDSPEAFGSSPDSDRISSPDALRALLSPTNVIFVASQPDRLLGSVGLVRESQPKAAHHALIWGVYVTPSHRGARLGRDLLAAAVALARTWPGLAHLNLMVGAHNLPARRTYESLGFHAWATERDALRVAERSIDEIHMRLTL